MEWFALIIIVGFKLYFFIMRVRRKEAWKSVANRYHLKLNLERGRISGTCQGHYIHIDAIDNSSGNLSGRVKFNIIFSTPQQIKFKLIKQRYYRTKGPFTKLESTKIGNAFFDKHVFIQTGFKKELKSNLTHQKRLLIISVMSMFKEVEITDQYIEVKSKGSYNNFNSFISALKALLKLADEFSEDVSETDEQLKLPEEESIVEKVEPIEQDEIVKEEKTESKPQIETKEPPVLIEEPIANEPEIKKVNQEELCHTLFGSDMSSYDAERYVKEHCNALNITFSGKLLAINKFSFDMVFKNRSGVKATIELADIKTRFSTSKVKLFACFDEKEWDTLNALKGENITITGEILSVNGVMKQLYIENSHLK